MESNGDNRKWTRDDANRWLRSHLTELKDFIRDHRRIPEEFLGPITLEIYDQIGTGRIRSGTDCKKAAMLVLDRERTRLTRATKKDVDFDQLKKREDRAAILRVGESIEEQMASGQLELEARERAWLNALAPEVAQRLGLEVGAVFFLRAVTGASYWNIGPVFQRSQTWARTKFIEARDFLRQKHGKNLPRDLLAVLGTTATATEIARFRKHAASCPACWEVYQGANFAREGDLARAVGTTSVHLRFRPFYSVLASITAVSICLALAARCHRQETVVSSARTTDPVTAKWHGSKYNAPITTQSPEVNRAVINYQDTNMVSAELPITLAVAATFTFSELFAVKLTQQRVKGVEHDEFVTTAQVYNQSISIPPDWYLVVKEFADGRRSFSLREAEPHPLSPCPILLPHGQHAKFDDAGRIKMLNGFSAGETWQRPLGAPRMSTVVRPMFSRSTCAYETTFGAAGYRMLVVPADRAGDILVGRFGSRMQPKMTGFAYIISGRILAIRELADILKLGFIDEDADGLPDAGERDVGTQTNNWDSDRDGVSDGEEFLTFWTDPLSNDTDNDGISDRAEIDTNQFPTIPNKIDEDHSCPGTVKIQLCKRDTGAYNMCTSRDFARGGGSEPSVAFRLLAARPIGGQVIPVFRSSDGFWKITANSGLANDTRVALLGYGPWPEAAGKIPDPITSGPWQPSPSNELDNDEDKVVAALVLRFKSDTPSNEMRVNLQQATTRGALRGSEPPVLPIECTESSLRP